MKCQGQSSMLPLPYSWWSERKCNSGAKGHAGKVKCGATMQFPQLSIRYLSYGKPHLKQSHSSQCSLHFPTCLLCLSACLPHGPPKPPQYLEKFYHLPILSSTTTVSMPPLQRPIPSYLSSLSSSFVLLGKCFHTLCFLFHSSLSWKVLQSETLTHPI